jgi:hypothetical protein
MTAKKKRKNPAAANRLQTATAQRAEAMGWSEHDRAARKEIAGVLRNCRRHYRKQMPDHWQFMVRSARIQMYQAVMDCQSLDDLRMGRGDPALFMEAFAVYNNSDALAGIHCRAYAELLLHSRAKTPASKASASGDEQKVNWKFALERIREALRDGRSVKYALYIQADDIHSMAETGQAGFFEDLGDLLRKHRKTPFKRSLSDWIVRVWLPLCLWECDKDGREAHRRFCNAAELLGLDFPGAADPIFYHQFVTAWRNTRSKKMKLQGRSFVKSDGQRD